MSLEYHMNVTIFFSQICCACKFKSPIGMFLLSHPAVPPKTNFMDFGMTGGGAAAPDVLEDILEKRDANEPECGKLKQMKA